MTELGPVRQTFAMTTTALPESDPTGIPRDTFRARLKLARLHAGDLTIRQAATKCGLNPASWANWEKGMDPRGKVEIVEAIAAGLNVDFLWLLRGGPLAPEERRRPALAPRVLKKAGETSMSYATAENGRRRATTQATPTTTPGHAAPPEQTTRPRRSHPTPRPPVHPGPAPTGPGERRTGRVDQPGA